MDGAEFLPDSEISLKGIPDAFRLSLISFLGAPRKWQLYMGGYFGANIWTDKSIYVLGYSGKENTTLII